MLVIMQQSLAMGGGLIVSTDEGDTYIGLTPIFT